MFGENHTLLPGKFDLPAYRRDLALLDELRPPVARLSKLSERGEDSRMAVAAT